MIQSLSAQSLPSLFWCLQGPSSVMLLSPGLILNTGCHCEVHVALHGRPWWPRSCMMVGWWPICLFHTCTLDSAYVICMYRMSLHDEHMDDTNWLHTYIISGRAWESPEHTRDWKRCIIIYLYMILHSNALMWMLINNWKVKIVTILRGTSTLVHVQYYSTAMCDQDGATYSRDWSAIAEKLK